MLASPALMFRWDWNNDGQYDTEYSTNALISVKYLQEGHYVINLQVKDGGGLIIKGWQNNPVF